MSTFTYLRLKAAASLIRLSQPLPCTPKPDAVIQAPSRDSPRTIKIHVYNSRASKSPPPVLINFHGSGFVIRLHGSDDVFCRRIADETSYTVLDVQYRLAPENPFPAAANDAEDVVRYVLSRPEEYDLSKIAVSGFSAGGNIALGVGTVFSPQTIRTLLAIYPPVDLFTDPGAKVQPDPSGKNVIPSTVARLFNECYIREQDAKNALISPAYADEDFISKLPDNILIVTCAYDTLALETESLADKIEKQGGKYLVRKRVPGVSHAWDKSTKPGTDGEKKRDEVYGLCVEILSK